MSEINLIGGFYKSKTLPWSAQDVVNWVPVKSLSGGTRSPYKLRGLPGLRSLNLSETAALELVGSAPDGEVGVSYSFTYTATGGTPPYTFSLESGVPPTGTTFSAGTISGTPTTAGIFPITPKVTDSGGQTDSRPDPIEIFAAPLSGQFVFFWQSTIDSPPISGVDLTASGQSLEYATSAGYPFNAIQRAASAAGGTILCAVDGNAIHRSDDGGVTFTSHATARSFGVDVSGPVKAGTRWCFGATNTVAQYSDDDGETWIQSTGQPVRVIAKNSSDAIVGFFVNSLQCRTSSNGGASFALGGTVSGSASSGSRGIACDGSTFMFVGTDGGTPFISTSSNAGASWGSRVNLPFVNGAANAPGPRQIAAGAAGQFMVVGVGGEACYSSNSGASWTQSDTGAAFLSCVVYGDGRWVAIGAPDVLATPRPYYSDNGTTWTEGTFTGVSSQLVCFTGTFLE